MTSYDANAQAVTLPTATRLGSHWTQEELDKLRSLSEKQTDVVTAAQLHRTLFAVRSARGTLEEKLERAVNDRRYRKGGTVYDEVGYTSFEEMGF